MGVSDSFNFEQCSLDAVPEGSEVHRLLIKRGDVFESQELKSSENNVFILHVANDLGAWGAGFTSALDKHCPDVGKKYKSEMRGHGSHLVDREKTFGEYGYVRDDIFRVDQSYKLGDIQVIKSGNYWVVNLVAQRGLPGRNNPKPFNPTAFEDSLAVFREIVRAAGIDQDIEVIGPKMGTGLSRGSWRNEVEPALSKALVDEGIPVTIFEF